MFSLFDFFVAHPVMLLLAVIASIFLFMWLEGGGLQPFGIEHLAENISADLDSGLSKKLSQIESIGG